MKGLVNKLLPLVAGTLLVPSYVSAQENLQEGYGVMPRMNASLVYEEEEGQPFIGRDKIIHFGLSAILGTTAGYTLTTNWLKIESDLNQCIIGSLMSMTFGLWKEIIMDDGASLGDLGADFAGSVGGACSMAFLYDEDGDDGGLINNALLNFNGREFRVGSGFRF